MRVSTVTEHALGTVAVSWPAFGPRDDEEPPQMTTTIDRRKRLLPKAFQRITAIADTLLL